MADVAENKDYQKVLLLTSHLFEYPDAAWWKDLPDCRQAVREIEAKQPDAVFGDFLDFVEETGAKEYEDLYVRSFDFSQNTNLYLTTQERTDFGKQSEEMHHYKELFLAMASMCRTSCRTICRPSWSSQHRCRLSGRARCSAPSGRASSSCASASSMQSCRTRSCSTSS